MISHEHFFLFNGKLYKEGSPIVSGTNRGLRYGDGLFETIKANNGTLQFADEHFARLWKGLSVLQFDIPKHFTPDKLEADIISVLTKNKHTGLARIRVNVFRGDGGLYDAKNHLPNYIIESWKLEPEVEKWNSNGLVLGIYKEVKKSMDILSNLKHNNYLPYVMAALKSKNEKWNDALLLNSNNSICDTTIANIFLVKDEKIFTPSLNEAPVAGIMRQQLIRYLKENNFSVEEKDISKEELFAADEVFLTNSIYNLRWVQTIEDKDYINRFTMKIHQGFIGSTKLIR